MSRRPYARLPAAEPVAPKPPAGCLAETTGVLHRFSGLVLRSGHVCTCRLCWSAGMQRFIAVATGCRCMECRKSRRAVRMCIASHVLETRGQKWTRTGLPLVEHELRRRRVA